jgi:NADH dehydrogenase [ubiquinone] 1 alpha subcomplex assembly factor 7
VRGHKYCDPLADPGKADLTAHVDFQALARIAGRARLSVFGPLEQGDFLQTLGIGARTERLCAGAPEDAARVLRGASNRLIAPAEMGSLFKVLALAHGDQPVPAGFEAAGS